MDPGLPLWEALAPPEPTIASLSRDIAAEVCVVGLGGSGLAALDALLTRGIDAVGVDESGIAAGAAGRNGGFLLAGLAAFHHDAVRALGRDRAVACHLATATALAAMAHETPDAIRVVGSLRVAADARELEDCERQLSAMRADGLPVERWSGVEGEGLLFPADAAFQPVTRCRQLAQRCIDAGGRLYGKARVTGIEPGRVRTTAGDISCRIALVCVDGRLEQLLPALSDTVRSARLQMVATEPAGREVCSRPVYRRYGYDYYQQLPSGELVAGGGRDVGGDAEWTTEATPTPEVQASIDHLVAVTVGCAAPVSRRWAGIVGYTQSGLPVVRQVDEGVFAAGGYCGTGNVVGRIAGRALVELALDGASEMAQLFDAPAQAAGPSA